MQSCWIGENRESDTEFLAHKIGTKNMSMSMQLALWLWYNRKDRAKSDRYKRKKGF